MIDDGPHPLTLLPADELARLAERARLDAQSGVMGEQVPAGVALDCDEEAAMFRRGDARLARGLNGLRFAARCYALARDPKGLRPIVWGAQALSARRSLETKVMNHDRLATAVLAVGARVLEVPGLAERLASAESAHVRRALAEALPEGAASEPILRVLAGDDDARVRAAARAKVGAIDRFGGAFPIPPDGHPDEVLEAARVELDRDAYERSQDPARVVRALAPLADALAVACWERVLATDYVPHDAARIWLAELVARPGGGAALARAVARGDRGGVLLHASLLDHARESVPEEARARAFDELIVELRAQEAREREAGRAGRPDLCARLAEHAVAIAPARGDARALLELILGGPIETAASEEGEADSVSLELSNLLATWPLDPETEAALIEARRAGRPGRWARVGFAVWERLGPDPVLRERAWRDLDGSDRAARLEAVRALLGPHHDPEQDGERLELARRLYARPELRAAVLWDVAELLPEARAELERGELDVAAAIVVMERTPAGERTDAMWAAARALRDRALAAGDETIFRSAATLIRIGEADASDLAFARAAVEHGLATDGGCLALLIGVLERIDAPESAALLAEIDARATTDRLREVVRAGRQLSASMRRIGH